MSTAEVKSMNKWKHRLQDALFMLPNLKKLGISPGDNRYFINELGVG